MRRLAAVVILLIATSALADEVNVFAAASLSDALQEITARYEKSSGDRVVFNFGASSMLARQIENGAPADLFLSADEAKIDRLASQKLILTSTRVSPLSNTLVIVGTTPMKSPRELTKLRVAIAEPSTVPSGVYAHDWLTKLGLWREIEPHVIPTDNVRAALATVEAGNADAAIVYATDARLAKRVRVIYTVPRAEGPKIAYAFAVVAGAEHERAARRFLLYLQSGAAKNIFTRYGFLTR
ncbi:MAG TPA: molybdate ABC transporter substrate-binding protein [Thermoanaerobaculia bacterium]|nr:molybdate ABC transporter substrate-binding protein [Thermoanaerobaculia bacterium]